jgi:hypothetical protein
VEHLTTTPSQCSLASLLSVLYEPKSYRSLEVRYSRTAACPTNLAADHVRALETLSPIPAEELRLWIDVARGSRVEVWRNGAMQTVGVRTERCYSIWSRAKGLHSGSLDQHETPPPLFTPQLLTPSFWLTETWLDCVSEAIHDGRLTFVAQASRNRGLDRNSLSVMFDHDYGIVLSRCPSNSAPGALVTTATTLSIDDPIRPDAFLLGATSVWPPPH